MMVLFAASASSGNLTYLLSQYVRHFHARPIFACVVLSAQESRGSSADGEQTGRQSPPAGCAPTQRLAPNQPLLLLCPRPNPGLRQGQTLPQACNEGDRHRANGPLPWQRRCALSLLPFPWQRDSLLGCPGRGCVPGGLVAIVGRAVLGV